MSSCPERMKRWLLPVLALLLAASAAAQPRDLPGIGRAATPKEVAAWDIDVRPDFKGLPKGSGSVARGQEVWEAKCAQCHGIFGESGEVFNPLVGGTSADDIKTGRVARLDDKGYPGRTTLMKVATVSTLWDYINRAMPWTAPKTLSTEEVYAVTAFLLNLGGVVGDDFVLSDRNIAEVQARMPNRKGMTLDHALWPGKALGKPSKPDVQAQACMSHCPTEAAVASMLPEHARNAHGNLADQNRAVGAQHGVDTTRPAGAGSLPKPVATAAPVAAKPAAPMALLNKYSCTACHAVDNKLVGPPFREIAKKYAGRIDAEAYLAGKIRSGGSGVWGGVPMPPQSLGEAEAATIAQWLKAGALR
ncbi:c-type cytochrome [Pelomonas sp. SE-A7]|uniref:c-type cytochrome n=1 Tax=Pelomonas sp. SE-A7 TaxID=3054953 RepID=UPI00259D1897|nr:c-type cytochrome [Pelomonas sp. SE-A7]MDM4765648.1 c-type cytochrome [Pelomonas sp. SE-A7]